ncbi:hypothetical protein KIM372_00300 [Bombiscardovia nodaiensis]|uniref:Uncharacterized protein n=1 Tax=Bombiscardovia nodaiensis TaxID=2932181 RepID=A0ABM8B5L1_9BIFI|nr:hypothetical protein KIM372_00300 [Bombiscardovia nodaiensis]
MGRIRRREWRGILGLDRAFQAPDTLAGWIQVYLGSEDSDLSPRAIAEIEERAGASFAKEVRHITWRANEIDAQGNKSGGGTRTDPLPQGSGPGPSKGLDEEVGRGSGNLDGGDCDGSSGRVLRPEGSGAGTAEPAGQAAAPDAQEDAALTFSERLEANARRLGV